jgi:Carboxypeptidase regulatory-like domain
MDWFSGKTFGSNRLPVWLFGLFLLGVLAYCPVACGQAATDALLRGTILDSSGAVVPGAIVTITNDATNVAVKVTADQAGRYIFNGLRPATYTLTVEFTGFKTAVRPGIVLRVAQETTLDLTLEVGDVGARIEVQGASPLLNSESASLGQEVDNRYVAELPILDRRFDNLVFLAPGVTESNTRSTLGTIFVSNGQRTATAEYRMDGVTITVPEYSEGANTLMSYRPHSIESIQEFKIQNNSFSAEYGSNGGTVINVATKSGGNQLHGSGYWFGRRPQLDANNFFSNRAGTPMGDFVHDQYGGSVAGPVVRNKTFFYFDYDRIRDQSPRTLTGTVPTALERSGDFSKTLNQDGTLQAIFNPSSVAPGPDGDYIRQAFPGNMIPPKLFDPVAQNILKYYPNPTGEGDPVTHTDNYDASGIFANPVYTINIKIDHNLTGKQRLSGRYLSFWDNRVSAELLKTDGDSAFTTHIKNQSGYLEHTWTAKPGLLWTNRVGVNRLTRKTGGKQFDFTSLGFPSYLGAGGGSEFPPIDVSGYLSLGIGAWTDELLGATQYQFASVVDKVTGPHNLKFGGEQRIYFSNYWQPGAPNGWFTFSGAPTNSSVFSPVDGQGNAFAAFLLGWGDPGSWTGLNILPGSADKSKETAFFVQDDWRVTERLTLNLGLRYEWSTPYTDRYNRTQFADPDFDTGIDVPGVGRLRGAALFATSDHRAPSPDRNNLAPRLGLAYRLTPKTVLRAGAGIYYGVNPYTGSTFLGPSFSSFSQWITTLDGGITRYGTFENPYPAGVTQPDGTKYGKLANWGLGAGTSVDKEMRNAEIYQWNGGIQHQLGNGLLIDVSYSASRSTHLLMAGTGSYDYLSAADRQKWGTAGLNELVPNPFQYLFVGPDATFNQPTSIYNFDTIPRATLLERHPQFQGLGGGLRPISMARYNALFVRFEKRYSHGLTFVGAYTFSKATDDAGSGRNTRYGNDADNSGGVSIQDRNNLRSEYGTSGADAPQRLVAAVTYELPVGRGKAVGSDWGRALNALLGGWQTNGLITFQSGLPLAFAYANSELWDGAQRPNISGNPRSQFSIHDVVDRKGIYFDKSAFSSPAPQVPGTAPRYDADARGSGIRNLNASFFKDVQIKENLKVELRAEFFNFTNTPRFGNPGRNFGSRSFGTISSQMNSPRQSQMGLRVVF